jgi:hypothetical protein
VSASALRRRTSVWTNDTLTEQLRVQADFIQAEGDAGDPGFAKLVGWNIPAVLRVDSDTLVQQRGVLCGLP